MWNAWALGMLSLFSSEQEVQRKGLLEIKSCAYSFSTNSGHWKSLDFSLEFSFLNECIFFLWFSPTYHKSLRVTWNYLAQSSRNFAFYILKCAKYFPNVFQPLFCNFWKTHPGLSLKFKILKLIRFFSLYNFPLRIESA